VAAGPSLCRRPAPRGGEDPDPAAAEAVAANIRREEAALLPPLQVSALTLILGAVAVTSLTAGFLVRAGGAGTWGRSKALCLPLRL
jgi:hypothetical protein